MTGSMQTVADIVAADHPADPPPGFVAVANEGNYAHMFGTVFAKLDGGRILLGFRCSPRHLNPNDSCHGGVVAAFADLQPFAAQHEIGYEFRIQPTINLSVDYLSPIRSGDWVQAETSVLRKTPRMIFSLMTGYVGDQPVFHSRGIFRVSNDPDPLALARLAVLTAG